MEHTPHAADNGRGRPPQKDRVAALTLYREKGLEFVGDALSTSVSIKSVGLESASDHPD